MSDTEILDWMNKQHSDYDWEIKSPKPYPDLLSRDIRKIVCQAAAILKENEK